VSGLLLDTQAFLWMSVDDDRLSRSARREIENTVTLAVSVMSFWEIALKLSRRGLDFELPLDWDQVLQRQMQELRITRIDLVPAHCRRLQDLPWHHKDPFDRMLVAQAQEEKLAVLSSDRQLRAYDVKVIW
jgi:PIN domain nuclease of toxin-antitoxin system